ncbi:hypothetical protein [Spiroplasma endosymbiont of Virgichneumon dumeticola]|uniref:hypothetical protein n=1 Tax=Spiroplasma endosymbiont of Virgichneumon dumeticola TaxID=3139323 RepID=UPI0035C8D915
MNKSIEEEINKDIEKTFEEVRSNLKEIKEKLKKLSNLKDANNINWFLQKQTEKLDSLKVFDKMREIRKELVREVQRLEEILDESYLEKHANYNLQLDNLKKEIINLKKQKISKFNNFLIKIITFGCYDKNKFIENKINKIQKEKTKLEANQKDIWHCSKQEEEKKMNLFNKTNSIDLQNQPLTSGYKPNSPKM